MAIRESDPLLGGSVSSSDEDQGDIFLSEAQQKQREEAQKRKREAAQQGGRKAGKTQLLVNRTRPEVHGWQALFSFSKTLLIMVGCFCTALFSGTTNGFNPVAANIAASEGLNSGQFNLLVTSALIGPLFTVPAGFCNDTFGPFRTVLLGMTMSSGGYIALSFLDHSTYPLMCIFMLLVGFGGGFAVTSSLATALKVLRLNPGIGVFIPAAAMSLSMAASSLGIQIYSDSSDCHQPSCWRNDVRLVGILIALFQLPAAFYSFRLFEISPEFEPETEDEAALRESNLRALHEADDIQHFHRPEASNTVVHQKVTFVQSLAIVKNKYAWVVGIFYSITLGGGLVVVSQLQGLIVNFGGNASMVFPTITSFAFANGFIGGGLSGIIGDFLTTKYPHIFNRTRVYGLFLLISTPLFFALGILSSVPPPHSDATLDFFILLLVLVGVVFGSNFVFGPSLIGEVFGGPNFGVFFGFVQIFSIATALAVPSLAGINLNHKGNAAATFFAFQYLISIGGLILLWVKPEPIIFSHLQPSIESPHDSIREQSR